MNESKMPGYGDPSTWPTHARELISDEPFDESREYQDWLAESADHIAHGHNVTWDVRRGFGMRREGVMFDDVFSEIVDMGDYQEPADALVKARLLGEDTEPHMSKIRAVLRVKAMEHLAAKADSYAEYLKQQEQQDMAEAKNGC